MQLAFCIRTGPFCNDAELFDCDYYAWKDKAHSSENLFEGELLAEYSWGEYILGKVVNEKWEEY